MGAILLRDVVKRFGEITAVDHVSLEIGDGEIVCLLGPSGCGKTTTLRMIAGFERPSSGEIYIEGRLVSSTRALVPPEQRNLGMVFQNYAVWPHMTVFDNVAYPLKLRKVPKSEIREKVMEVLRMVGLEGLERRYPEQLSGGQQQRVALARALVVRPTAMLLDEPLSNLDAKLRERMRFEIMDLHRRTGITVVYVTHDQAEAMVLSDRIAVMNQGKLVQVGSPMEIYQEPVNSFVADFIGIANLIPARLVRREGAEGEVELEGLSGILFRCRIPAVRRGKEVVEKGYFFVRPEAIELVSPNDSSLKGRIVRRTYLGNMVDLRVEVGGREWRVEADPDVPYTEGDEVGLKIHRAAFLN